MKNIIKTIYICLGLILIPFQFMPLLIKIMGVNGEPKEYFCNGDHTRIAVLMFITSLLLIGSVFYFIKQLNVK